MKNSFTPNPLHQTPSYLYLDTSEPEAVIGIFTKGGALVHRTSWEAGRSLSATLSEKYKEIILETASGVPDFAHQSPSEQFKHFQKSLNGIVVFVGPGSFTGLRIGISFANGLAYALSIPIYETREKEKINLENPQKIALPYYDSEPKITKPKIR